MADDREPLLQNVELNENLASAVSSKRKRGAAGELLAGAGVEGEGGAGGACGESGSAAGETSLESSRWKRRNGGAPGPAGAMEGMGGKVGGGAASVEGAQTRKRKSLEKVAAVVGLTATTPEHDAGSASPSRESLRNNSSSSKKRKPSGGLGDDAAFGMDGPEPTDEGRVSRGVNEQGPVVENTNFVRLPSSGLRLRFTRSGNSLAAKKVVPAGEDDAGTGEPGDRTEAAGVRSRGSFEAGNRSGEEPWTMPSQAKDHQSHPSTRDVHGTNPYSNSGKVSEKSPLTRELYRIPSHAGWFSWSKIHNIERRSLGEFFDGKSLSKTPKIYKEYRDFIINKYREKEQHPLTFTEVRRMLIGDVNALRRVFDFLDHWGLINHQAGSEANQEPSPTPTIDDGVPSGVRVALGPVVSPVRAANIYLQQSESSLGVTSPLPGIQIHSLPSYRNAFAPAPSVGEIEKTASKVTCSSCGGDCSKLRFHYQDEIQAGLDLCQACFKAGRYGSGRIAKDFVRVDGGRDSAGDQWTTKETLSLLEAIGRFGDNWNQVADYVGTKSRAECVKQFIRLPFGDRFLGDTGAEPPASQDGDTTTRILVDSVVEARTSDDVHEQEANMKSNVEKHSGPVGRVVSVSVRSERRSATEELSPFQDVSNPLLSQVALMSAMVGPRVAAAAAQAAITTIAEDEPALANHPIMNGSSTVSAAQQSSDSRSKESSRPEAKEQGLLGQEAERELVGGPSAVQLQVGIATSLAAAAVNARLLADQEEREMELLMTDIIENQFKTLYAKLEHFEELEMLLEKERLQVEQARQTLYAHQIMFTESRLHLSKHG